MAKEDLSIIQELMAHGHGYKKIAQLTNLPVNTVKSYCRRYAAAQPKSPESETGAAPDAYCRTCGKPLYNQPKCKPKAYCSDACRMKWWNSHRDQVKRKAYYTFICPQCGKSFQSYGQKSRKYCSVECANAAMRKVVST